MGMSLFALWIMECLILLGETNPCGLVTSAKETDGLMTFSGQC